MPDDQAYENTHRELYRDGGGDGNGMNYYEPHMEVDHEGRIWICVGGTCYGRTLREWHALADLDAPDVRPSDD